MDKNNKQTVEFTKEQFFSLMKAVYLGNWMANAARMDTKNFKKDYEQILDYIFSLAPKFGLEKYMDHDSSDGERYFPSRVGIMIDTIGGCAGSANSTSASPVPATSVTFASTCRRRRASVTARRPASSAHGLAAEDCEVDSRWLRQWYRMWGM